MSARVGQGSDKFMLRLPDGMRDEIKAAALLNERSMNTEIIARLQLNCSALRDQFAMAALTGLLSNPKTSPEQGGLTGLVRTAAHVSYAAADAMLAERQKGGA